MGFNSDAPVPIVLGCDNTCNTIAFAMHLLSKNWENPLNIEESRPSSAILYHNMDTWMPPGSNRVSHQPSLKTLLVSCIVPATAVPVTTRKRACVNPTGQQHNDAWGSSTRLNDLFPVSVNLYGCDQGHITAFPVNI